MQFIPPPVQLWICSVLCATAGTHLTPPLFCFCQLLHLSNAFTGHLHLLPWQRKKKKPNPEVKNTCLHIFFFFSVLNQIGKESTEHQIQLKQWVVGAEKLGRRPSYFGSCLLVYGISSLGTAARENGTTFLLKLLPKLAHHGVRQVSVPGFGRTKECTCNEDGIEAQDQNSLCWCWITHLVLFLTAKQ